MCPIPKGFRFWRAVYWIWLEIVSFPPSLWAITTANWRFTPIHMHQTLAHYRHSGIQAFFYRSSVHKMYLFTKWPVVIRHTTWPNCMRVLRKVNEIISSPHLPGHMLHFHNYLHRSNVPSTLHEANTELCSFSRETDHNTKPCTGHKI
jgi:hypothetical protein